MKVIESKETIVIEDKLIAVACNKCGEIVDFEQSQPYQSFDITFGYGPDDNKNLRFEICDECIKDIVKGFKIEPEVTVNDVSDWEWPIEETENFTPNSIREENTYED